LSLLLLEITAEQADVQFSVSFQSWNLLMGARSGQGKLSILVVIHGDWMVGEFHDARSSELSFPTR
jgi:hypothetical protein